MLDWNRIQGLRISNQANSKSLNSLKASLKQSTSESPVKIDEDVPELTRNKQSGKNYLKSEIINCYILNCDINRYKCSTSLFFARGMFFAPPSVGRQRAYVGLPEDRSTKPRSGLPWQSGGA